MATKLIDNDADDAYIRRGQVPPKSVRDYDADDPRGMTAATARRLSKRMRGPNPAMVRRMEESTARRNFYGD